MAVKAVQRRELTFWEKLYIPQIICGLKITSTHFFVATKYIFIWIDFR